MVRHITCGGSHHFLADPSPYHRRRLISCSGPSWEPRETLQQMGFRLVTFSAARLDYIDSSAGSERPEFPGALWAGLSPSRTQTHPSTGEQRGLFAVLSIKRKKAEKKKKPKGYFHLLLRAGSGYFSPCTSCVCHDR